MRDVAREEFHADLPEVGRYACGFVFFSKVFYASRLGYMSCLRKTHRVSLDWPACCVCEIMFMPMQNELLREECRGVFSQLAKELKLTILGMRKYSYGLARYMS
jgi:hypothetical protein